MKRCPEGVVIKFSLEVGLLHRKRIKHILERSIVKGLVKSYEEEWGILRSIFTIRTKYYDMYNDLVSLSNC